MKTIKNLVAALVATVTALSSTSFAAEVSASITIIEASPSFTDVKYGDQYYDEIQYLLELGTLNGYDDGTFRPLNTVTRAEMVKVITASVGPRFAEEGVEDVFAAYEGQNCFSDVLAEDWHSKYICFAKDKGWISGYDDGSFKPAQEVNFVEALKIAFMGFGLHYSELAAPWYQEMVDRAQYYGYIPITVGSDYGKDMARGELAALIRMMVVFDPDAICPLSEHFADRYYAEDEEV